MARIKSNGRNPAFSNMEMEARLAGETNDCAVKAVAFATGTSYAEVHQIMARLGRRPCKGTSTKIINAAIKELGFSIKGIWSDEIRADFINHYPGAHKNLCGLTTHHPARFPKAWARHADRTFLALCSGGGHILCIKDARTMDWTEGKAKRVSSFYEVVPAETR